MASYCIHPKPSNIASPRHPSLPLVEARDDIYDGQQQIALFSGASRWDGKARLNKRLSNVIAVAITYPAITFPHLSRTDRFRDTPDPSHGDSRMASGEGIYVPYSINHSYDRTLELDADIRRSPNSRVNNR